MSARFRSSRMVIVLLAVLLAASQGAAAGLALRYRMPQGDRFTYVMRTWANVPFYKESQPVRGEVNARTTARFTVDSTSGALSRLSAAVTWDQNPMTPAGSTSCTFDLDDLGVVSDLQSPDMGDPKKAAVVRSIPFAFPRVPAEPVQIGSTWLWPTSLALPAAQVDAQEGASDLRIDVVFKVKALAREGGHSVAVLEAEAKEKPGQKYEVRLKGPSTFDVTAGRLSKVYFEGTVKAKVLLFPVTVPVKTWIDLQP